MNYIIFDLEWNNAYNYKTKKGINEIIEIGALKLNSNLEVVDSFKQLIKPRLSRKLGSRFKKLTHITIEEIREKGVDFNDAFNDFSRWCGNDDNVFLSWSNSDLHTLISNFKKFKGTSTIEFMKKYADAQKYCMSFIEGLPDNMNQIGLTNCAEAFGINIDDISFHRALDDCYVTARCFKKVFDEKRFNGYVVKCDFDFFERLTFKNYFISNPVCNDFDINKQELICPSCKGRVVPVNKYEFLNNTFKNAGICENCDKRFWIQIRAKKTYDDIIVTKRLFPVNKKKGKLINNK